jgi:hypothetical protein
MSGHAAVAAIAQPNAAAMLQHSPHMHLAHCARLHCTPQPTPLLHHPPLNVWQLPPPSVHCVYCAMWLLFIVDEPQLLSLPEPRKSG